MELAFESEQLRNMCEDDVEAERLLEPLVAATLRRRLADLRAASSVNDLLSGGPQFSSDGPTGSVLIQIGHKQVIQLVPNHVKNPVGTDGRINWHAVSRLRVVHIGPFNEQ